jgi:hypothetical protein
MPLTRSCCVSHSSLQADLPVMQANAGETAALAESLERSDGAPHVGAGPPSGHSAREAPARGARGVRAMRRTATEAARTDSDGIIIRWGHLRGAKAPLDVQALYFPIECARSLTSRNLCGRVCSVCTECASLLAARMRACPRCAVVPRAKLLPCSSAPRTRTGPRVYRIDEHRARAWWKAHKHHLRVGDAVVQVLRHRLNNAVRLEPRALLSGACAFSVSRWLSGAAAVVVWRMCCTAVQHRVHRQVSLEAPVTASSTVHADHLVHCSALSC